MELQLIQQEIRQRGFDGWLFYDFHNRDLMAYRILGMDETKLTSRRWFYWVPAEGEPVRLAHKVEPTKLDLLPGRKVMYLAWKELHERLRDILGSSGKRICMQFSPQAAIPYVSIVDGGTIDLIRSFGHDVVSSADLVQIFEAAIDVAGYRSHVEAGQMVQRIKVEAFEEVARAIRQGRRVTEYDIQQFIVTRFDEEGLTNDGENPIVGVREHPANPHFEPTVENAYEIRRGDTLLIDLWAKRKQHGAIYYDITWCGFVGPDPSEKYVQLFKVVCDARDAALRFVRDRFRKGDTCYGWEVDDACRSVVVEAGWGDRFIHRTGHSIGQAVHGNGVNIDNLETKDERALMPGICFSVEPGIYLADEMAVRTEIDVFITHEGEVTVAGDTQESLVTMDV